MQPATGALRVRGDRRISCFAGIALGDAVRGRGRRAVGRDDGVRGSRVPQRRADPKPALRKSVGKGLGLNLQVVRRRGSTAGSMARSMARGRRRGRRWRGSMARVDGEGRWRGLMQRDDGDGGRGRPLAGANGSRVEVGVAAATARFSCSSGLAQSAGPRPSLTRAS